MPLEFISGRAVNPGAGPAALTMSTGDVVTVRNTVNPKLLNTWYQGATAGFVQVRSVLMHDNTRGIRLVAPAANPQCLMPMGLYQPLKPLDNLTLEIAGGGAETDVAGFLLHYDQLPGAQGRFIDEATLRERAIQPWTMENTPVGVAGNYSATSAFNATTDFMKADYDYALVGYEVTIEALAVTWRGPDTGNIRVAGPGNVARFEETREWFLTLSRLYGLPCIPIFSGLNRASSFVESINVAGTNPVVRSIFYQLTPEGDKKAAATSEPTSRSGSEVRSANVGTPSIGIGGGGFFRRR